MMKARKLSLGKKVLYAPIPALVLLLVAELALRAVGYQSPTADSYESFVQHRPVFELEGDHYRTRTSRRKFFHDQTFTKDKSADTLRIVAIGGSVTYGYNLPNPVRDNFAAVLVRRLESERPGRRVELINCGGICYSSYRLTRVVAECLHYSPDVVIIACGHNEFLEPRHYADLMKRSGERNFLDEVRVIQLARQLSELVHRPDSTAIGPRDSLSADYIDLRYIVRDAEEIRQTLEHFARNLQQMVDQCRRAGVKVVLCTEPSNLRDWPPFRTEPTPRMSQQTQRERLNEATLQYRFGNYEQALKISNDVLAIQANAGALHFMAAKCYEALDKAAEAKREYVLAKDTDAFPHRTLSSFNERVRQIARDRQVSLYDAEAAFAAAAPDGIPGFELFIDQCHPNNRGHDLLAAGLQELLSHGK